MSISAWLAILIFVVVFVAITFDWADHAALTITGGTLMVFLGLLSSELAYEHIDWNVLLLLIGMMIQVGILQKTGVFQYLAIRIIKFSKGKPMVILVNLCLISAIFSAFFDNVTTIIILVPISILIAVELGLNPINFVLSEIFASNIGGASTLIGDPPNILIGSAANLSYIDFVLNMGPVIIIVMVFFIGFIFLRERKNLQGVSLARQRKVMSFDEKIFLKDKPLLKKVGFILGLVFVGFLFHSVIHVEAGIIALSGAGLMLLAMGKEGNEEILKEVEWSTIFFFLGLFIMVYSLEHQGVMELLSHSLLELTEGNLAVASFLILWSSGIASGIVDNVPFVATMIPLVEGMLTKVGPNEGQYLWWSLALGACLGGNFTIIGASANVVGIRILKQNNINVSFIDFFKLSGFITLASLIISSLYVFVRYVL